MHRVRFLPDLRAGLGLLLYTRLVRLAGRDGVLLRDLRHLARDRRAERRVHERLLRLGHAVGEPRALHKRRGRPMARELDQLAVVPRAPRALRRGRLPPRLDAPHPPHRPGQRRGRKARDQGHGHRIPGAGAQLGRDHARGLTRPPARARRGASPLLQKPFVSVRLQRKWGCPPCRTSHMLRWPGNAPERSPRKFWTNVRTA
mmetsp:Transcript_103195/g.287401  ORF Transcript_103195/g.287401 Transcript_103195/m.287401 type:complete len:202 (-) Transcript_103195:6-611(-)